jgi:hypothetical protein
MKITEEGKKIAALIGYEEAELLYGLINNCLVNFPLINRPEEKNTTWSQDRRRLANMRKELGYYIGINKKKPGDPVKNRSNPKDTPCPYCKKTLRGDKALSMHLVNVHGEIRQ